MTTFKNNAKYGELMFQYLDLANVQTSPLSVPEVLSKFNWRFRGGSLRDVSQGTRLKPQTSYDIYPEGLSGDIAKEWPNGENARALRAVLRNRARHFSKQARAGTLGTWLLLTSSFGLPPEPIQIESGMRAIYWTFSQIWRWSERSRERVEWDNMMIYCREMGLATAIASHMDPPTVQAVWAKFSQILSGTRVPALLVAVYEIKELIKMMSSPQIRSLSSQVGGEEMAKWEHLEWLEEIKTVPLRDMAYETTCLKLNLGPLTVRVGQRCCLLTIGQTRMALSMCDAERLHQLTMSATSALVGCACQTSSGTQTQRIKAEQALRAAEQNIERIVVSSGKVPLGDEVLVCKGYRRAYTAHLGVMAGKLGKTETDGLIEEAKSTAPPGVLDIEGYMDSLKGLTATGMLDASKVFKICPAPDVSPGCAMMERIKQIGNCNVFDPKVEVDFTTELRDQILRAYIRGKGKKLKLRDESKRPLWYRAYTTGHMEEVPTAEIHRYLMWEGSLEMPAVSPHDPKHWKDSGLGADSVREAERHQELGYKKNMITRLLFDDMCPMPGGLSLNDEHVIKFFVKAEGHKDPARGIFSANLRDRQAQSWMEIAVESVAKNHPSFMIGTEINERDLRIQELIARPSKPGYVALYYSFDISGWSAKMPAEPQRISHKIWRDLYGGHMFDKATQINENAYIYMSLDGYRGWFRNTAANLEGFNGKEMTMILVALLSLSVREWRKEVVAAGVLTEIEADQTVAFLLAYIDDGLCRIDLPRATAERAFSLYKTCVISTFARCGYSVETTKCFPSDRFAIFLNEVYIAGRHVTHGVRAAMGISAEPTERHHTLIERVTSVSTGCRGAVMAGLSGFGAVMLMAFHSYLHIREWVPTTNPHLIALWSMTPRSWGGLGLPNMMQMTMSGSGAAFEEGVATLQGWAQISDSAEQLFLSLCKAKMMPRSSASVLTAPLSCKVSKGYMVDSRVAGKVRDSLRRKMMDGRVSVYASRLLKYADLQGFQEFADAVTPIGECETVQEQMLLNVYESHPHSIFSAFAARVEKSNTVLQIIGLHGMKELQRANRVEALESLDVLSARLRGEEM